MISSVLPPDSRTLLASGESERQTMRPMQTPPAAADLAAAATQVLAWSMSSAKKKEVEVPQLRLSSGSGDGREPIQLSDVTVVTVGEAKSGTAASRQTPR